MPRKPRIEFPGALYHIFSRGNNKQEIFLEDRDRSKFMDYLRHYKNEFSFALYAYVLMRNHFHLLIQVGSAPASKIMQCLIQSYTQYFNTRHERVGHLFQGRYKAILCEKEEYLKELIRYLHLNPVRAGYVERPEKYQWASHRDYLVGKSEIVDVKKSLECFARKKSVAIKLYKRFINDGLKTTDKKDEEFYESGCQTFVVDGDFVGDIYSGRGVENSPVFLKNMKNSGDLSIIWGIVTELFGISRDEIVGKSRNKKIMDARAAFVLLSKRYCSGSGVEIAKNINRDPKVVTNLSKRGIILHGKLLDVAVRKLNSILQA